MTYNLTANIDNTKTEFNAWHKAEVIQTDKLYELLAKILEIVENVNGDYDENKINEQLKKYEIKVKKESSLELKVTRLVMVKQSKKAAAYAKALTVARQEHIDSKGFAAWLKKKGGIEKVRNSVSIAAQQAKNSKQFDLCKKKALAKSALGTVKLKFDNTQENDLVLLVGRVDGNDEIEIIELAGVGENSVLVERAVRNIK